MLPTTADNITSALKPFGKQAVLIIEFLDCSPSVSPIQIDERTEIELLFRNLSHRPTAIIDIYVREKEGGILGGSAYNNNIKLPIELDPWGVIRASFGIEKNDEARMANILVKDIEDNEIVVVRGPGQKWVKAK